MKPMYCQYCGELLSEGCDCKREIAEARTEFIESLEERQHQNGFYTFQDMMDSFRRER